jgi:hypothetical protein
MTSINNQVTGGEKSSSVTVKKQLAGFEIGIS